MKLNNSENFTMGFTSVNSVENFGEYPTLENCVGLRVLGATEWMNDGIMIVSNNSISCFINGEDEISKQNLIKILPVIQRDHIGENLENLINFEFNLAERIS